MIDALASQRYTMIIKKKYSYLNIDCDIKVTKLKKINDSKFEIEMEGKDRIGSSKLKGILIFKGAGLALKLSKVYNDR